MKQISLAITTYCRTDVLIDSFSKVYSDDRIKEIVIVDDVSPIEMYNELEALFEFMPKVKLFRNEHNLGVYYNKKRAIELCSSAYVIILDSDNKIDETYLDKVYSKEWYEDTIFAPDFAKPVFDYTYFAGNTFTNKTVGHFVRDKGFDCLANTCNYFVNRGRYLDVFEDGIEPVGSDSIHQLYNWLRAGYRVHVLKGLQYEHRVWDESHYRANAIESTPLCEALLEKLALMK